ncbi:ATP-binding cassette domain-containing protein [Pelagibacterium sp. 26DY04]|uniref:ATP-binding cassette domain-containing protein n=1 Tax=Pelagibacterium sp. 26DY04 TaxID=2967130 RepID=UPI00281497BC|nr:ATP-binding cassette domain-containing protein [Pelagibacterium sp. 26DY04]WMT86786.1 ATP-binding cassette domain-containing protein [Pelagibacterium sp. 26DY04]
MSETSTAPVVLSAKGLVREYPGKGGLFGRKAPLRALKGVDLTLHQGQTLAVVGESGCGKSTLARILTLIDPATDGELTIDGTPIDIARERPSAQMRRKVRIVFQSPYNSLNPRQKIGDAIGDELLLNTDLSATQRHMAVLEMLERVGLLPSHADRYPHMFSGGQRQRVAIARALMVKPKVVILDEPVSALDLSVQAQVLNLLAELQADFGLSYIFISHDLSVVRRISDEVMVMNAGEVVERGPCEAVFSAPSHPYTRQLLEATPSTDTNAIRERIARRAALRAQKDNAS